jgi:hypothetical protein
MEKVRIAEPIWMDAMYEHYPHSIPEWTGEYFSVEDEIEDELTDEYGWGE